MPLYEYQCDSCGHRFEVIQKFSDPPPDECPKCRAAIRKLQSAPAIQFKGAGWYITDYAKKDTTAAAGGGQAGGGKKGGESAPTGDTAPAAGKTSGDSSSASSSSAASSPATPAATPTTGPKST